MRGGPPVSLHCRQPKNSTFVELYLGGEGGRGVVGGGEFAPPHPPLPLVFNHSKEALGFGLWGCLPDPKRALGAHGVPLIGEGRLRRTSHTLGPCGLRVEHRPPSAVVLVLGRDIVAGHTHTESGTGLFIGSGPETVACGPLRCPTGVLDA